MKRTLEFIIDAIVFALVVTLVGASALWDSVPVIWRELRENRRRTISLRRSA